VAESVTVTTLQNSVFIEASSEEVWSWLARLDALPDYDPAVASARIESLAHSGLGAERRCELKDGNWFRERVSGWEPERALAFELCACSLPVRALRHSYRLTAEHAGTRVEQRMHYELKFGPFGAALDALFIRRKWNAGIVGFLAELKRHVESHEVAAPRHTPGILNVAPP